MTKFSVRAIATASSLSAAILLMGCGSNPQQLANVASAVQGNAGGGGKTQLATGIAQAALVNSGSGQAASSLPAKMSCKEISGRLIKARSASNTVVNAAPGAADNKIAMAAATASLVGALSGNSQLAGMGSQLGAVSGGGVQGSVQDSGVSELQARAATQNCKLPLEAQVSPAISKMSCKQLQTEWSSGGQAPSPAAGIPLARGGAQDKLAMAGAAASLAGALTGNKELVSIAEVTGQATGSAQGGRSTYARDEIQIAAKARQCKLAQG